MIGPSFEGSDLPAPWKATIRYADAFLSDPHGLSEATKAAMLEHFTPSQIVEITMTLALCMGFSKIAVSLGQAPDDMPVIDVPTPEVPV